jgi:hypothetical protein
MVDFCVCVLIVVAVISAMDFGNGVLNDIWRNKPRIDP